MFFIISCKFSTVLLVISKHIVLRQHYLLSQKLLHEAALALNSCNVTVHWCDAICPQQLDAIQSFTIHLHRFRNWGFGIYFIVLSNHFF